MIGDTDPRGLDKDKPTFKGELRDYLGKGDDVM